MLMNTPSGNPTRSAARRSCRLFSYPRKSRAPAQLAKGTGTEFLTPAKEFQDALAQGLKDAGEDACLSLLLPAGNSYLWSSVAQRWESSRLGLHAIEPYPLLLQIALFTRECTMSDCLWKTWSGLMAFYQGVLGLELNKGRPDNKLPYAGAWLWIGR